MRNQELKLGAGLRLRAWAAVCRGGPWPSRGCLRRRRVPRLTTDLPLVVGADSISARGRSRRRGVRRDEGIPPYDRPGWRRPSRLAQNAKFIRRGGIYPARRCLRCHRVPGTMQASSPTEVCDSLRAAISHLPRTLPSVVGADSISARGRLCCRGVRRDEGIPPYGRPESGSRSFSPRAAPGWPKT